MRNDARDDDLDNISGLSADPRDFDDFPPPQRERERERVAAHQRGVPAPKARGGATGPLWALVGALLIAMAGLGWWSFQHISLMQQQLVATQESFARISEEAAGRLQDISGKVVASESTVNSGSEALKAQIQQLQNKLQEQGKQQQGVAGQASDLDKRLAQITAQLADQAAANAALQAANAQLQDRVKSLAADQAALKGTQFDPAKMDAQLKSLSADVAQLKKQGTSSAEIDRIQQDLLVLKSEQDNRAAAPAAGAGGSTAEFDSFRAQVTRNITALSGQVENLQQQLNARQGQ